MSKAIHKCPKCGNPEPFYVEDISCKRPYYKGVSGVLVFDSLYSTEDLDDGTNPRLLCPDCGTEYPIPDELEIDFV